MSDSNDRTARTPERRAFPRRALRLRGEVDLDGRQRAAVRFVDFCEGGLFLSLDDGQADFLVLDGRQVVESMRIWATFEVNAPDGARTHRIPLRVARILDGGIGVAYDPPDIATIVALQRLVEAEAQSPATPDSASVQILDGVHERVSKWLASTLRTAFKATGDELFVAVRDAANNEAQSEVMDAIKDVERVADKVCRDCRISVLRGIERLISGSGSPKDGTGSDPDTSLDSGALTLVDTGSFDDWVTAKNIMSRAEPRLRDAIYELSQRLSLLSSRELDEFTNPIGIQQLGMSFNESMQNLGLNKRARKSIYKSFDEVICGSLARLYELLNGYLVEQGVLPVVQRPKAKTHPRGAGRGPGDTGGAVAAATDTATGALEQDQVVAGVPPGHAAPAPPPGAPHWSAYHDDPSANPGTGTAYADGPQADPWAGIMHEEVVAGAAPLNAATPAIHGQAEAPGHAAVHYRMSPRVAPAPVSMGQAYSAARNLMGLRRTMTGASVPTRVDAAQETPQPQPLSPRLQQALNAAQQSDDFNHPRGAQPLRLAERLMSALARDGVELSQPQREAMDVLSTLVEALLGDPMITTSVKPRIKRLALPMLKAAMKEQEFFTDESHPARQVVNRIGMLDLPETLAPGAVGDCLTKSVDPLLDRIVADDGTVSSGFLQALPELDQLLLRQKQRYDTRLAELMSSPEHAQALASALAADSVSTGVRPWMERATHLNVGDAVRFGAPGKAGEARVLAWVSEDRSLFVFTDRDGSNGGSMSRAELAQYLANGHVQMLDAPEVLPMDRGIFSMLEQMHSEVAKERERDGVTGLMSPSQFRAQIEAALERAKQVGAKHALLALDIDGFSIINDHGGRKAGDSLLRKLSRLFGGQVGNNGALTRTYADKFLLLLSDHGFMDAKRFAQRQCKAVANSRVSIRDKQFALSLSVGLVPVTRASADVDELIDNANAALATAKLQGNQVRIYDPDEDTSPVQPETTKVAPEVESQSIAKGIGETGAAQNLDVDTLAIPGDVETRSDIFALMETGRLLLTRQLVQPLSEQDAKPHYEILLGMPDEKNGVTSLPGNLIADAERENRMADVDRWVIRNTLSWMQRNRREVLKSGGYAINLSGNTLSDGSLLSYLMEELTRSAVPPAKVIFEVTESVAIDRLSNAVDFIRTMREYGCRFSIDDFGAGHATFTYLKTLPVDYVKIDGLFVREMASEPNDQAMVKSIHEISHLLGKKTVAEHVESDQALGMLKTMGVDFAQGYAVARPEPLP